MLFLTGVKVRSLLLSCFLVREINFTNHLISSVGVKKGACSCSCVRRRRILPTLQLVESFLLSTRIGLVPELNLDGCEGGI